MSFFSLFILNISFALLSTSCVHSKMSSRQNTSRTRSRFFHGPYLFYPINIDLSYNHDKWNIQPKDVVRSFGAYISSFDGKDDNNDDGTPDILRVPEWVAYQMKADINELPSVPRPQTWLIDPSLNAEGLSPQDSSYLESGYDRGHMCMRAVANRYGPYASWNSNTYANCCPQLHSFNNGIWGDLETKILGWANRYKSVWVICGPIFENKTPQKYIGSSDKDRVAVPTHFFKILVAEYRDKLQFLSFIFPHKAIPIDRSTRKYSYKDYFSSIDQIEKKTGLDFFTDLEDSMETKIEAEVPTELWS